jgi:hypothetical protein
MEEENRANQKWRAKWRVPGAFGESLDLDGTRDNLPLLRQAGSIRLGQRIHELHAKVITKESVKSEVTANCWTFQHVNLLAGSDLHLRSVHLLGHYLFDHALHLKTAAYVQGMDV